MEATMRKLTRLVIASSICVVGCSTLADEKPAQETSVPVSTAVESSKKGWVKLTITNTSDKVVRFLDAREGTATVYDIWRIEAKSDDRKKLMPAGPAYASGGTTLEVSLQPGQQHVREFQLGAYFPYDTEKSVTIVIHYDVRPEYFRKWTTAPYLRFSSPPLRIKGELPIAPTPKVRG
jgi:hypothetical protein